MQVGWLCERLHSQERKRKKKQNKSMTRPSKNHVKDTRNTSKTMKDESVSALRDRPNSPQNIIKSHFNGLETARGDVPKSTPI